MTHGARVRVVIDNAIEAGDQPCRSCWQTTARSRGERSTANSLGRSRPAHAASCAAVARYRARPPCRATSREITEESRPNRRPISLYSRDSARPREISSRSVNINILRTAHPAPPTPQDQMLRPAELKVYIEPNEEHWHGATEDRFMAHVAMQEADE